MDTPYITYLNQPPHPQILADSSFLVTLIWVPALWAPLTCTNFPNTTSLESGILWNVSSSSGGGRSHFTSRPPHTLMPTIGKESFCSNCTEGKRGKDSKAQNMQHTQETIPEASGPGEQGTLHCRALQYLFFIRLLCLSAREIADFPSTHKQILKYRQNEE